MKLTKDEKRILNEDIKDLNMLIDKYLKEKKFEKASNCLAELRELENKLNQKVKSLYNECK